MPLYQVKNGKHYVTQKDGTRVAFGQGCEKDVVELSSEEAAKFVNKFTLVEAAPTPAPKPAAPAPKSAPAAPAAAAPAAAPAK